MLNKTEKEKIQKLVEDDIAFGAVEKVFLSATDEDISLEMKNELIGEVYRGNETGKKMVERGLRKLQEYKMVDKKDKPTNPAL